MRVKEDIVDDLYIIIIFKCLLALDLLRNIAKYLISNEVLISSSDVRLYHDGRQSYRFQFAYF